MNLSKKLGNKINILLVKVFQIIIIIIILSFDKRLMFDHLRVNPSVNNEDE